MKTEHEKAPQLIVFSDLDGTLLDHESYSWEPAREAIESMQNLGIPLILASSKTAPEIMELRHAMGFEHCPAIVENGSGLLPAGAAPDANSAEHAKIVRALNALPKGLRAFYQGFSDWSDEDVAARTGLELSQARLAKQRQFSEPGLWSGPDEELIDFVSALKEHGISARQGGRYLTLSFGATKADQMSAITQKFVPNPATMALGDAPNDIEMIEAADHGVIISNSHGADMPTLSGEQTGRIIRTEKPGPEGWNIAVLSRIAAYYTET